MSYVPLAEIGCNAPITPWAYYDQGPDTMFMFPQTIATSGKTTNLSPAAILEEGQAFFAEQCRLGGWIPAMDRLYHQFYSESYPASFLPPRWNAGMHVAHNQQTMNYNMGQCYLNNAFCWALLEWDPSSYSYVPFNRMNPASLYVPIFNDPTTDPIGVQHVEEILKPIEHSTKYGQLIVNAVKEAQGAMDGFGCCGMGLRFLCSVLDRTEAGWQRKNKYLGDWWQSKRQISKTLARMSLVQNLNTPV